MDADLARGDALGHLADGDGEEQSGTVSHDWLEHQPNGDGPPLTLLSSPRGEEGDRVSSTQFTYTSV